MKMAKKDLAGFQKKKAYILMDMQRCPTYRRPAALPPPSSLPQAYNGQPKAPATCARRHGSFIGGRRVGCSAAPTCCSAKWPPRGVTRGV